MGTLVGSRILVLEEQEEIALLLTKMIHNFGCEVLGPVTDVAAALALLESSVPDAAILDVSIVGKSTLAVADELTRIGTPFAFVSGNKTPAAIKRYAPVRLITKPYSSENIHRVLLDLIESGDEVGSA